MQIAQTLLKLKTRPIPARGSGVIEQLRPLVAD